METKTGEPKVWEGIVLTVPNCHYECCGKPPGLNSKDGYTAYFENKYGDQMMFQYNYKTKKGTLWHGDYGWDHPVEVMGGGTTMIMGEEEQEWLRLVWRVATRGESKEFQLRSSLDLVNAHKAIYEELLVHPQFADSKDMLRHFTKTLKNLEKQAKLLSDQIVEAQIEEATQEK